MFCAVCPNRLGGCYTSRDSVTANWKSDLSSQPVHLRVVPSFGGASADGRLKASSKPENIDKSLHRFGQGTLLGVYRWLILCLIAFILAHWVYLSTGFSVPPEWGTSAHCALQTLLPEVVVCLVLLELERRRPLLTAMGFEVGIDYLKS